VLKDRGRGKGQWGGDIPCYCLLWFLSIFLTALLDMRHVRRDYGCWCLSFVWLVSMHTEALGGFSLFWPFEVSGQMHVERSLSLLLLLLPMQTSILMQRRPLYCYLNIRMN
jgi:hypothetical protein